MLENVRENDLSALSRYYIKVYCDTHKLDEQQLLDLLLDCIDKEYQVIFNEGFEVGKEEGYEEGEEHGREMAEYDDDDDKLKYSEDDMIMIKNTAYEDGYKRGYITGCNWFSPECCQQELKDV